MASGQNAAFLARGLLEMMLLFVKRWDAPIAAVRKFVTCFIGRTGDQASVMKHRQGLENQCRATLLFAGPTLNDTLLNLRQGQTMTRRQKRENLVSIVLLFLAMGPHLRRLFACRWYTGEFHKKRARGVSTAHTSHFSDFGALTIIVGSPLNRTEQKRAKLALAVVNYCHCIRVMGMETILKQRRSQAIGQLLHLFVRVAHS